ncbi:cytochrome P460 family protein [Salinisphaera sp. P385]|uniref:Cytochrome P460 family protein n=1 Tax=Spectribacter acetivorans TaxID=3075603 RepID=A0ABU3B813_9GAMM|nr:cytochrome P460 family protein [Salinisphaera sp. P385]MDT0618612.1 cytochrome P460 family protein [Salinisphaera sp. P385]
MGRVLAASMLYLVCSSSTAEQGFSPYVDDQGNISFPDDFRTSMVHMGSWFVPEGGASGFHDVYTEKKTVAAFRETGEFPDGATLVKELRSSNSSAYTTGPNVSHATKGIKQWFVMIKDTKGRFSDNPLWGDGWGWALYKPDNQSKNVATDYQSDCLGCHIPAQDNDLVYIEGYPILRASAIKGERPPAITE